MPNTLRGSNQRLFSKTGLAGLVYLIVAAAVCIGALPWSLGTRAGSPVPRFDEGELSRGRLPPSAHDLLGTDILGRSLLVRCIAGGGVSLLVGVCAAVISVVIGTLYGAIAGYAGGRTDSIMMRVVDVLYGLPYILLVVLLAVAADSVIDRLATEGGVTGRTRTAVDVGTLLVAIGGVSWLTMARVIRGQVLSLKARPFIEAARAMGASPARIFLRHLLPNLAGPIVVYATLTVPQAILQESFLSFLGIGIKPPLPSWGNLAADALGELNPYKSNWWLLFFPCLLLCLTLLALNYVGESLREALDPAPEAAMSVLRIRDLSVRFGEIEAARSVSLTVHPRQTVAVVGESGSGKTVTALSVLGLLGPSARVAGRVEWDGADLLAMPAPALRRIRGAQIAMIFQEPMTSLNPVMTIGEQIVEAIRLHQRVGARQAAALAATSLAEVGIDAAPRRLRQYPHEFSGGMRQRAMIAMALACGPRLLIADEPTTALDVTTRSQILSLLDALKSSRGLGILFITHDLNLVARFADVVCVMYRGRVVEYARAAALLAAPRHPYTRALLQCVPRLGRRTPRLVTIGEAMEGPGDAAARWRPEAESPPLREIVTEHWAAVSALGEVSARPPEITPPATQQAA